MREQCRRLEKLLAQAKRSDYRIRKQFGEKKLLISNTLSWKKQRQQNVDAEPKEPAHAKNVIATANVAKEKNVPAKENVHAAAIVANFAKNKKVNNQRYKTTNY